MRGVDLFSLHLFVASSGGRKRIESVFVVVDMGMHVSLIVAGMCAIGTGVCKFAGIFLLFMCRLCVGV